MSTLPGYLIALLLSLLLAALPCRGGAQSAPTQEAAPALLAGPAPDPQAAQLAPMPPNTVAITYCVSGAGMRRIRSVLDMGVLGSDSLAEVVAHEAMHRAQMARRPAGTCPDYGDPLVKLADEIEAYCASRPVRMRRGFTKGEVDGSYIARLMVQFAGLVDAQELIARYFAGCP